LRNKIVPRATYQRVDRFNLQVGETTERLARLYALALSVFENRAAAARFLMNPHPELDDRTPFDVALTEIGGREVEEVIERGLHGLPA
jgi:putative toxin-antitoxin system antitoxin component (TIGR02293 family)